MEKKKRRKEDTSRGGGGKDGRRRQHNSPPLPISRPILGLFSFCILLCVEGRINSVDFPRHLRKRWEIYLSPTYVVHTSEKV